MRKSIACLLLLCSIALPSKANTIEAADSTADMGVLTLPPLFEYPVAPEDLSWEARSNWLVEHFWDNFDHKQKSVGQHQLIHAFKTYVVPMHFADRDVTLKSVKSLISKIKNNPTLLLQFTQAAEHTIYSPETADIYIDEVYVDMVKAMLANKKIPKIRKARYNAQLKALENCLEGNAMPEFAYTDKDGGETKFKHAGVPTIIEFGDYDCSDCRMTRLRLETDIKLQQLVEEGKARIMFISPDVDQEDAENWKTGIKDLPSTWTAGRAEGLEDNIDLRHTPCLYLIDASGKIISKNATTDKARSYIKTAVTQE